ncbi:BON domain-containing protein [Balneatrix alpica]|uniref:BON domain-containing protein n=1 Tax=Balneatrix alpica TaxID=75684 RepID=A0ABV5Z9Q6_9GAMM|nr:BON domain-containing protein [Balneatrix alpica]
MKYSALLLTALLSAGALVSTGCSVVREQQTVGSYIDDATLTTRVKARFAEDKTVSALAIKVETLEGVVQLSGFAKTEAERQRARQLAQAVPGVKGVQNDILLRP